METQHTPRPTPQNQDLLPIREAYEWKLSDEVITQNVNALLPIREAYEWKLAKQDDGVNYAILASNS